MKSAEEIAQWVIDNRYPKSENNKVSDAEMYQFLIDSMTDIKDGNEKTVVLALEYGYRSCEYGKSLQKMLQDYEQLKNKKRCQNSERSQ